MTDSAAAALPADQASEADQPAGKLNIGRVLFIALVVGLFTVVWLVSYTEINDLIWNNSFVSANRWTIPVGVLFFSLLVGLVGKYMHAPNVMKGNALAPLAAGDTSGYKSFWGALLTSFFSLFSGASVGPEGPIGFLSVYISEWLAIKLKLAKKEFLPASLAGMSSAYNGIVGNPLFATLFASEMSGGKGGLPMVAANLAAGAVGYLLFALLNVPPFASFLYEGELAALDLSIVVWAIGLGLVGGLLAIYTGIAMNTMERIMSVFGDRIIARTLTAGVVIGAVCFFIPNLMFSGEDSIHSIIADAAQIGVPMLFLMALLKPLLLSLSFKSGYLGGPIFPSLFAATMMALAIGLLVPQVPLAVLIACSTAGIVTLVLKAPLTSILLVTVMTGADANLMGLIVVAVVAAMILGGGFKSLQERRRGVQTE